MQPRRARDSFMAQPVERHFGLLVGDPTDMMAAAACSVQGPLT